jgi:hypothetical protein
MLRRLLVMALALALGGCGSVGMMVDSPTQYGSTALIPLKRAPQNFIESATQVGTSLGYHLSGTDTIKNAVQLSDDESLAMTTLIGKMRNVKVTLTLEPGGRQIKVELMLIGNFDQANQTAAEGRLAQLRTALAARFD